MKHFEDPSNGYEESDILRACYKIPLNELLIIQKCYNNLINQETPSFDYIGSNSSSLNRNKQLLATNAKLEESRSHLIGQKGLLSDILRACYKIPSNELPIIQKQLKLK